MRTLASALSAPSAPSVWLGSSRSGSHLRTTLLCLVPLLLTSGACRYRLGHPPVSIGLSVGDVQAPVAEPGVADALAAALGAAIRRAGAQGQQPILARVERASYRPSSSRAGQVQAWEAVLAVTFVLTGPQPQELRLERSTMVATPPGAIRPGQLRGAALEQLAEILAEEAVSSFLYAPASPSPSPGVEP